MHATNWWYTNNHLMFNYNKNRKKFMCVHTHTAHSTRAIFHGQTLSTNPIRCDTRKGKGKGKRSESDPK